MTRARFPNVIALVPATIGRMDRLARLARGGYSEKAAVYRKNRVAA
jgi:hypothetical protein